MLELHLREIATNLRLQTMALSNTIHVLQELLLTSW
jgi:hypothetical protein